MTGLFETVLRITLNMSVLAGLLLICVPFLKKRYSARWRYWAWLVIAARLIIPLQAPPISLPALSGPAQIVLPAGAVQNLHAVADSREQKQPEGIPVQDSMPTTAEPVQPVQVQQPRQEATKQQNGQAAASWQMRLRAFPWKSWAIAIWIGGMAVAAIWQAYAFFCMRRMLRRYARPVENTAYRQVFDRISAQMGCKTPVRLMRCSVVSSPMVCGFRKIDLFLPGESYPLASLEMIFRHEIIHVMRRDLWYKTLLMAVSIVHWFNPVVHWMVRTADRDLEISCDERVTRGQDKGFRTQYSEAILEVMRQGVGRQFVFSSSFCDEKKAMMHRLSAIFDAKRKCGGAWALACILTVCLFTGSLAGCSQQPVVSVASPQEAYQSSVSSVQPQSGTPVQLSEQVKQQLQKTANIYENYCSGQAFEEGNPPAPYTSIGIGYLGAMGKLEEYLAEDDTAYRFSDSLLAELSRFFIVQGGSELIDSSSVSFYSLNFGELAEQTLFTLEERDLRQLENGDIAIEYRRVTDQAMLSPVRYVFRPVVVETVPAQLESEFHPGDTVYQIVSVQNLEMEQQPLFRTIEISTPEQLLEAVQLINEGGWLNQYNTYLLTADIDLTGIFFTPMGMNERYLSHWNNDDYREPAHRGFQGVFDGQGHTISGLTIDASQFQSPLPDGYMLEGVGLFSNIGQNGIVKNLNLVDCVVTSPCESTGKYGAAGLLAGNCDGILENISVQGTVSGGLDVGGMVGTMGGSAVGCTADVTVSGFQNVGGFAGDLSYGYLQDCTATGQVIAVPMQNSSAADELPSGIGGLFGFSVQCTVEDCTASAYLSTEVASKWVGAFAGFVQRLEAERCRYDLEKTPGWECVDVVNNPEESTLDIQPA